MKRTLLAFASVICSLSATAHDDVGSTDYNLLVPDFPLNGSITFVTLVGPAAGEELLHTTWNLTFSSPPDGTKASDVILELQMPLETGAPIWEISGADLGWPAATGTYSGTLGSELLNGVLAQGLFGFTTPELVISSLQGGVTGKFISSTIALELAPHVCQHDLGLGGPGTATLEVCGDALATGASAELGVKGGPAIAPLFLVVGLSSTPTPFKGGTLVPVPVAAIFAFSTDMDGQLLLPIPGGGGPATMYIQAVIAVPQQPAGWELTNAVAVALEP